MKLLFTFFGKFEECADRSGVQYPASDWRSAYIGRAGLIAVYESERKAAGKRFVYFYPDDPDSPMQDWLRTSAGDLKIEDGVCTVMTNNSRYVFTEGEDALTEESRLLLRLNSGLSQHPEVGFLDQYPQ